MQDTPYINLESDILDIYSFSQNIESYAQSDFMDIYLCDNGRIRILECRTWNFWISNGSYYI